MLSKAAGSISRGFFTSLLPMEELEERKNEKQKSSQAPRPVRGRCHGSAGAGAQLCQALRAAAGWLGRHRHAADIHLLRTLGLRTRYAREHRIQLSAADVRRRLCHWLAVRPRRLYHRLLRARPRRAFPQEQVRPAHRYRCRLRGALSTLIRHSHVEATGFR